MDVTVIDVFVPMRGMPKARPRTNTKTGDVYMPVDYQEWRRDFAMLLKSEITRGDYPRKHAGPVEVYLSFYPHGVRIQVMDSMTVRRKHVRGDIDNLIGGVMEVLEDTQVVTNDSKIHRVVATVAEHPADEQTDEGTDDGS
jgi:Holliday junction resolvase RusA-like endonuclease